jgi:hypothetical protein
MVSIRGLLIHTSFGSAGGCGTPRVEVWIDA